MMKKNKHLGKVLLLTGFIALMVAVPASTHLNAEVSKTHFQFFVNAPQKSKAAVRSLTGWLNTNGFDVAGINLNTGVVEVITSEEGVKFLKSKGLNGKTIELPIVGGKQAGFASRVDPRYYNPDKIAQKLNELHAKYPSVTNIFEIGKSLKGRPIYAMLISSTPNVSDPKFFEKPSIMFDAMHHAREVMTPEVVMDIGESLLSSAMKTPNGLARRTIANANVWILPMLNVDGNSIVWSQDNMWRKNARSEGNSTFGVDINRNYPYKWASCNGSSGNRGAQDYHGASEASEPETQAVMKLAEKIHPMASISYHSYSELVLYPYGCDGDVTGEHVAIEKLGKEMAAKLPSDGNSSRGYTPGTAWDILYAVDGDSMSYLYSAFGAVSYVFEINQSFQPSYDLRDPTVKKHRVAWSYFLEQVQNNQLKVEVRDTGGKALKASLNILQIPHIKGERDFATNEGGNFFKVLLPGKYVIEAKTKMGKRTSVEVNMDGKPQTVKLVL